MGSVNNYPIFTIDPCAPRHGKRKKKRKEKVYLGLAFLDLPERSLAHVTFKFFSHNCPTCSCLWSYVTQEMPGLHVHIRRVIYSLCFRSREWVKSQCIWSVSGSMCSEWWRASSTFNLRSLETFILLMQGHQICLKYLCVYKRSTCVCFMFLVIMWMDRKRMKIRP